MKQQAVNTFSEGINFDLNPLNTPNNVLTDCINGTFLTFNGDELILQNDAGNTSIPVNYGDKPLHNISATYKVYDIVYTSTIIEGVEVIKYYENKTGVNSVVTNTTNWKELPGIVTLTEGFYPLGIKEYGGVLYIISGKKGLAVDGSEDMIEFGSYPSPEYQTHSQDTGVILTYSSDIGSHPEWLTNYQDILYKPTVINNEDFKSGRYVTFDVKNSAGNDDDFYTNNISYYQWPIFYKVKLLQILTNGTLDLTNDVWEKYNEFRAPDGPGSDFWFNDPTFKYFCPNHYKGKLAVSLEIEPLTTFRLADTPILEYNGTNVGTEYTFTINFLGLGGGAIYIPSIWVKIWVDGEERAVTNEAILWGTDGENGSYTFTTTFPVADQDKLIKYEIVPNLGYNYFQYTNDPNAVISPPINAYTDFPIEYRNNYIVTGQRLMTVQFDKVKFLKDPASKDCALGLFKRIEIVDNNLAWVDLTYAPSLTPFVFLYSGETPGVDDTVVANYTMDPVTGFPIIDNLTIMPGVEDSLLVSFEATNIKTTDVDCGLITITVNTNIPIDLNGVPFLSNAIDLIQSGNSITPTYDPLKLNKFEFKVQSGVEFTLDVYQVSDPSILGYYGASSPVYTKTCTQNTTINHAFTTMFYKETPYAYTWEDPLYTHATRIIWHAGTSVIPSLPIKLQNITEYSMEWYENQFIYRTVLIPYIPGFADTTLKVLGTSALTKTWDNLSPSSDYKQLVYGDQIFIFSSGYTDHSPGTLVDRFIDTKDYMFIDDNNPLGNFMGLNSVRQLTVSGNVTTPTWSIIDGAASATIDVDGIVTTTDVPGLFTVKVEEGLVSDIMIISNSLAINGTNAQITLNPGNVEYLVATGTDMPSVEWTVTYVDSIGELILDTLDNFNASITSYSTPDNVPGTAVVRATEVVTTGGPPTYAPVRTAAYSEITVIIT